LVERNGKGVILAGMHGAGKSTCCSRLPDNWNALCDDEVLVVRDSEGNYLAHSFPTWSVFLNNTSSEKSWNVQHSVPICGVFFIEQSEVDSSIPLGIGEKVSFINESGLQVYRKYRSISSDEDQKSLVKHLFENSCEMARHIPVYKLRISLDGSFWDEITRVLEW
jgi:SynChlorMet cassette protein ScmC